MASNKPDLAATALDTKFGAIDRSDFYNYGKFSNAGKFTSENSLGPMENCVVKSVFSGLAGGALGIVMGVFMGSMDNSQSFQPELQNMTVKESLKHSYKLTKAKSVSFMKNFAVVGFVYSGTECIIEKTRGTHDIVNPVLAGCATGGFLASGGGPQAAVLGCGGFAAFSYAIECYMES